MPAEFFPILRHPEFRLPWALVVPHAKQAMENHGQTLERLAERGGLSFSEALAVMCDLNYRDISRHGGEDGCRQSLETLIQKRTAAGVEGKKNG